MIHMIYIIKIDNDIVYLDEIHRFVRSMIPPMKYNITLSGFKELPPSTGTTKVSSVSLRSAEYPNTVQS